MRAEALGLLGLLGGCVGPPYELYWDDPGAAPALTGVSPTQVDSLLAEGELTLSGSRLGGTRTVILGGRNAEIVSASETEVVVRLPRGPAGGGEVDVVVVTEQGFDRAEGAFTWAVPGSEVWADERVSAMVRRYDYAPDYWCSDVSTVGGVDQWTCGIDVGFVDGEGFAGAAGQPGLAAELAVVGRLADLPPAGEVAVLGPGEAPPGAPRVYGVHAVGEALGFRVERDLGRDLETMDEVRADVEAFYAWSDAFTDWEDPVAYIFDDWTCWTDELDVLESTGPEIYVDGDPTGATGVAFGTTAVESYEEEVYFNEVLFATAPVRSTDGQWLRLGPSGVVLAYDDWSGSYLSSNAAGYGAQADLPPDVPLATWLRTDTERWELGELDGLDPVTGLDPDPRGAPVVDRAAGLDLSWDTGRDEGGIVVVELTVYDPTIDDPNGWSVVRRLVARGDDEAGALSLSAADLGRLPAAAGDLDDNGDPVGYHAYLTVTRHGLRRVDLPDGGVLVVDVVHATEGPTVLR